MARALELFSALSIATAVLRHLLAQQTTVPEQMAKGQHYLCGRERQHAFRSAFSRRLFSERCVSLDGETIAARRKKKIPIKNKLL